MHRWWDSDPSEHFWMEITDRSDVGVDLKAPQVDDSGAEKWTYALLKEVAPGDVVLHWSTPERALIGFSIADGEWWDEPIIWGAHGTSARDAGVSPYARPGIRRALTSYTPLHATITKAAVQEQRDALLQGRAELLTQYGDPLYFPFQIRADEIRAAQGYMVKFPRTLLELWPRTLAELPASSTATPRPPEQRGDTLGVEYRPADENVATQTRAPFSIDPNLVDRGTRGHARTQNHLADWVRAMGCEPKSPSGEPLYDLGWRRGDTFFVAEVKSLTDRNEERQLRLGLGQVLRYRQLSASSADRVVAVLMLERSPTDPRWQALCSDLDVRLAWPDHFDELA